MKKIRIILTTLIIMFVVFLLNIMEVQAALQANPKTHYKTSDSTVNWMKKIRKMETAGDSMGLNEELNADFSSKTSNGIDVHMMRTTEYGAIAILSASSYGNSKTIQQSTIKTTTGNKTGVYILRSGMGHREWIAGGLENKIYPGINKKYYDTYTTSRSSARVGDTLGAKTNNGCMGWHSSSGPNNWVSANNPYFKLVEVGLFGYDSGPNSDSLELRSARGVAVCGQGL